MRSNGLTSEPNLPSTGVWSLDSDAMARRQTTVAQIHQYTMTDSELIADNILEDSVVSRHDQELETALINFFGSYEAAMKLAHLYILECDEVYSVGEYTTMFGYRLRLKSQEELHHDDLA